MDAPQVAISLVIAKSYNVLSELAPLSQELKDQVMVAINDLRSMAAVMRNDQKQEPLSPTMKLSLLKSARDAENTIDWILTKVSLPPRLSKGLAETLSFRCSLPLRAQRRGNNDTAQKLIKVFQNLSNLARAQAQCPVDLDEETVISTSQPPSSKCPPPKEKNCNDFDIVGQESFTSNLETQLINKDANLHVISVFGEKAIGKTALVRTVYSSKIVRNHFDCRAWVRVPEEPNPVHLMVDLLKQVTSQVLRDVERMEEQELTVALQRILMQCRYLVVLDNLQDCNIMDRLILADSQNGSRVIITTRDPSIPTKIDPWYSDHLGLDTLNRERSGELLEKCCMAEIKKEVHPAAEAELINLKGKILSKCSGYPARTLLLGGLLAATEQSSRTMLLDQVRDSPTLKDVISLSYRELPYWLKPCALYLALFPKESEISTRRLFRLWLAEGLLFSSMESQAPIGQAEKYFKELVSRNLVYVVRKKCDGSARTCRLPSTLYDFFSQKAKDSGYFQICGCSVHGRFGNDMKFNAPRIAICKDISKVEEAMKQASSPVEGQQESSSHNHMTATCSIRQLLSYVSFNTAKLGTHSKEAEKLFTPLRAKNDRILLRVLDLEGVYKPALPEQLGKIALNLRYLGLRWTVLELLPKSVWQLPRLETLDMKYTNITQVPSSIWEAQDLQHLYMNDVCFDDYIPQNVQFRTTLNCNIQTVSGLFIGAKSPMLDVLGKLIGLRKLALTCHPTAVEEAIRQISNLTSLESLRLRSRDQFGQPSDLNPSGLEGLKSLSSLYVLGVLPRQGLLSMPPNLKALTLSMSKLKEDPMAILGKLKQLTTLQLFAGAYSGEVLSTVSKQAFPRLRILKLWKLKELRRLTIKENAMSCLEDLEIKDCKQLGKIVGLQHISTLEEVVMVKVKNKLAQRIEATCSDQKISLIRKELVICTPQNEAEAEGLDEDSSEEEEE